VQERDQQIIQLILEENQMERGFSLLVNTFKEQLYWHIRKMVKDHDFADEVLQNTFIKVYKGIKNFRADSKLYTWLYRIASNEAITFLKKQQRLKTVALDAGENPAIQRMKADDYFDSSKVEQLLQKALDQLPDKQRDVFCMRYYDDMSYKAISEQLGVSVGGLKANYHHAVKKIEEFIKNNAS
jgi:RNA polymerase sigma-70 factor (ECF subfamily)